MALDLQPNFDQRLLVSSSWNEQINILCSWQHICSLHSQILSGTHVLTCCMLTSVFLFQTPPMPPSPLPQETSMWAWRMLSWCVTAEDTPNLKTSHGHGTVTSPICALSVWPPARMGQLYIHSAHCNTTRAAKIAPYIVSECLWKHLTRIHRWQTKKRAGI